MAAVSNYSPHPCGPKSLMYSRALGGAVRRRTPSRWLHSLTVVDGSWFNILNTQTEITQRYCIVVKLLPWFSVCLFPRSNYLFTYWFIAKDSRKYDATISAGHQGPKFCLCWCTWLSEREVILKSPLVLKWRPSNIHCFVDFLSAVQSFLFWTAVGNNLSNGRIQTILLMSQLLAGEGQNLGQLMLTNNYDYNEWIYVMTCLSGDKELFSC